MFVVPDNPYSEVVFDGYRTPSFLQFPGAKEVGVEFNSLSKSYNCCGWRTGMLVGNKDIIAGWPSSSPTPIAGCIIPCRSRPPRR